MKKLLFIMLAMFFASLGWAHHNAQVVMVNGTSTGSLCNTPGFYGWHNSAIPSTFDVTASSSCPPPGSLAVPAATITTSQAVVTWANNPLAQEYIIEWKNAAVSWEDTSVMLDVALAGAQSFTLTQLQASMFYNVRIRAICDYGVDSSDWAVISFTSQCGNISVDTQTWMESFEGLTAANTLPVCWSATNFGESGKVRTQITDHNETYSRRAHTGHCALYFMFNCNDSVKTPSFVLTADSTYKFSFWYHTDGTQGWQHLSASVYDVYGTCVGTIGTPLSNITNTNYLKYQGTFTPEITGIYYFRIKCQSTSATFYLTIDDVSLGIAPTCPDVDYFTATLHSPTSVALNWDLSSDTGNGWRIAYSNATPFDPSNANYVTVAATDNFPYILSSLETGTTYNFAVQTYCGGTWTDPITITTPSLSNMRTVPYSQNFEDTDDIAEWAFSNSMDNNRWYIGSATSTPAGGNALYISNNNGIYNNHTPHATSGYGYVATYVTVDFGNYQSYTLSFDWHCQGYGTYVEYNCFKVFAVPLTYTITNTWPSGAGVHQIGGTFWHQLDWEHFHAVLPANIYANQQYKIVFIFSYDNGIAVNPAPAIDNLVINGSNCSVIANVTASSITLNSANISFTNSDPSQTSWEYVYGVAGTILDPNNAITNTTYSSSFPLNGLTENTFYNIWIRSTCATTSEWSQVYTFLTRSSTGLIPYNCTFESNNSETTTWQQVTANGSNSWGVGTAHGNGASQAGTQAAYITGNTGGLGVQNNYYYRIINFGTTPANFNLSFDYISEGYLQPTGVNSTALYVWLVDENTPVTAAGLPQANALAVFRTGDQNWHTYLSQLLNISGIKKLVFGYSKTNLSTLSNQNPVIDNISIEEVLCSTPTEVTAVTSITDEHDVTLSWDANGGVNNWIIYYKPLTATTWSSMPATSNPATLQGLTLSTVYNIYVVTDCGSGVLSNPSAAILYYTPCAAAGMSVPYTQNFEDYSGTVYNTTGIVPSCWGVNGSYALMPHITGSGSYHYPHSAPNVLTFSASGGTHSYAILPKFNTPVENLKISFWYRQQYAERGTLQVGYITGNYQMDMGTFTELADVPPSATLTQFTYEFPTSAIDLSNATYIVLHWNNPSYPSTYTVGVDDISVDVSNACPTPKSITVSAITNNSATVSWTSSASQWEVAWKTTSGSNWNYDIATSNTYTIPNLTAVTAYDVKVRTFCTADSSIWSPIYKFTTAQACTTPYIANTIPTTSTTATLTWTVGVAAKWIVEYKTTAATSWTYTDTLTTNSVTLNNLTLGTAYQARVKAICGINIESAWSAVVTFTPQAPCEAPTNINASATNSSITITWQANNNETNWITTWKNNNDAGQANVSNTPAYTFTGLAPGTFYHICVKAICNGGAVSDSTCTDISTTTGINTVPLANTLQLYPNPTTNQLKIMNYELKEGDNVEIYNMLGQKQSPILNFQLSIIDVSLLSAGMYMVKIGGYIGKFVKR